MKTIPAGCDSQGRYITRQWPDTIATQPAECCTELGAEPRGKHRAGIFTRLALWLRRVMY